MAKKPLFMGPRLKAMRRELGLTQANMAADLDISPSYIALMERNQRPATAEMLLKLASVYRVDIAGLAGPDGEELETRLKAALRDPIFADIDLPAFDVADIATSYPGFAEALLRLHTAHAEEQMALAERQASGDTTADPVAEARAFLAARANCFPALDDGAAALADALPDLAAMQARIAERHGLEVRFADAGLMRGALRWHDYHRRRILFSEMLDHPGRRFQLALQLAILEQEPAIEAELASARIANADTLALLRRALQSYAAAALLMPYAAFARAAEDVRYDIEVLAARFGVSFEQAAHRLTTLQKPGAEGVPFFFLRVDRAGNVSKRLDGAGFPFARHGGGCPLWNVHRVFAQPGRVDAQLVELPDGEKFVSIARTVGDRAVALACAARHADRLAYKVGEPQPIGITCRLCHRPRCTARSAPPLGREILPVRFRDSGVPFAFSGE
jgi:XRE family transcriptional regulator, fatty acid utilization regulator